MKTEITGYWTFMCDPKRWEIDKFLATNNEYDTYQVNDWYKDDVKPGQLGIIRVGIDHRTKKQLGERKKLSPGIYAVVEILDTPILSTDVSEFYLNEEDQEKEKLRVKIRYLKNLLNTPLLLVKLKQNGILSRDQYVINGFQRASMPLRNDAFEEIINLLGTDDQIFSNIEADPADTVDEISKLELKYQDAAPQVKEIISRRIERGNISSKIKKVYDYKCKICETLGLNPHSFKKTNGDYYIETHHIIHISSLMQGTLGFSNLITVCANHHRQFHFGDIKVDKNTKDNLIITIDGKVLCIDKKIIAIQ